MAAFDEIVALLNMEEAGMTWEKDPAYPGNLLLKMNGDNMCTTLVVENDEVTMINISFRDAPGETTTILFQMTSALAAGPALILAGVAPEEAISLALTTIFPVEPENWYTGDSGASGSYALFGGMLLFLVQPRAAGTYSHNMLLVFSPETMLESADAFDEQPVEVTFRRPLMFADYIAASEAMVSEIQLQQTEWVESETDPYVWQVKYYGENIGVMLRMDGQQVIALGATCTDEQKWAQSTFQTQLMMLLPPLATMQGMPLNDALTWWQADPFFEGASAGVEISWRGAFCGVPAHLTVEEQEDGLWHYSLLLLFCEGGETSLPGSPNPAAD